jgi:hypothetical protein
MTVMGATSTLPRAMGFFSSPDMRADMGLDSCPESCTLRAPSAPVPFTLATMGCFSWSPDPITAASTFMVTMVSSERALDFLGYKCGREMWRAQEFSFNFLNETVIIILAKALNIKYPETKKMRFNMILNRLAQLLITLFIINCILISFSNSTLIQLPRDKTLVRESNSNDQYNKNGWTTYALQSSSIAKIAVSEGGSFIYAWKLDKQTPNKLYFNNQLLESVLDFEESDYIDVTEGDTLKWVFSIIDKDGGNAWIAFPNEYLSMNESQKFHENISISSTAFPNEYLSMNESQKFHENISISSTMTTPKNKPPSLNSLLSDKISPQEIGCIINWTANATDEENGDIGILVNDGEDIQRAINLALVNNVTYIFIEGLHKINKPIEINNFQIKLVGMSKDSKIISADKDLGYAINLTVDNCSIMNISIEGFSEGIILHADNCTIGNTNIFSYETAINAERSNNTTLINNIFHGRSNDEGVLIFVDSSSFVKIINNTLSNSTNPIILASVNNSYLERNNVIYSDIGIEMVGCTDADILNNSIYPGQGYTSSAYSFRICKNCEKIRVINNTIKGKVCDDNSNSTNKWEMNCWRDSPCSEDQDKIIMCCKPYGKGSLDKNPKCCYGN